MVISEPLFLVNIKSNRDLQLGEKNLFFKIPTKITKQTYVMITHVIKSAIF